MTNSVTLDTFSITDSEGNTVLNAGDLELSSHVLSVLFSQYDPYCIVTGSVTSRQPDGHVERYCQVAGEDMLLGDFLDKYWKALA